MKYKYIILVLAILCTRWSAAQTGSGIYSKKNLIAWCIVPFDKPERTPEQRAKMLNDLGINKLAYDWREKHVPSFDEELNALKKHDIKLQSFWYYSGPEPEKDKNLAIIIDLFKRHNVKTEIWTMITGIENLDSMTQQQKVEAVSQRVKYIATKAAEAGCKVGLYNHGGWFGEPENQLAIIKYLNMPNIGIVYNFSHSETQIHHFPDFYPSIKPHLLAVNLTGLQGMNPAKVVPVGRGDVEFRMMKIIEDSDYSGPVGIINEDFAVDAKDGLKMNMEGLKQYEKVRGEGK